MADMTDINDHMARTCKCGCVRFNLLRSGAIECNDCKLKQEGIGWGEDINQGYRPDIKETLIAEQMVNANKELISEIEKLVDERDYWEEKATELADNVGNLLGFDFGEHSSANCPVQSAIEAISAMKSQNIVKIPTDPRNLGDPEITNKSGESIDHLGNKLSWSASDDSGLITIMVNDEEVVCWPFKDEPEEIFNVFFKIWKKAQFLTITQGGDRLHKEEVDRVMDRIARELAYWKKEANRKPESMTPSEALTGLDSLKAE